MFKKSFLALPILILGLFIIGAKAQSANLKNLLGEPHKIIGQSNALKPLNSGQKLSPAFEVEGNHIKNEVIVKFKPEIAVASAQANSTITSLAGAKTKRVDKSAKFTVVKLPKNISAEEAVKYYENLPNVEYAELNHIVKASWSPNDPNYSAQWHFSKISLSSAWDYDTTAPLHGGDPSIVVAVIDTGIAYESYDIYSKAPDFTGSYPAFTQGYDYINNDSHPNDDQGHGTHVASTIAESTDNSVGAAGIAFNSTIMPVKVLAANGSGSDDAVASGITYAKDHGAHILSMSIGSTSYSQTIADAVAGAVGAGKILIAAAGNGGQDGVGDPQCDYPGRYDGVICVGSTAYQNDHRSTFSNYGTGIDIVAPGGQTSEGYFGGFYGWGIGTYATLNDCVNAVWTNYGIIDPNLCVGSDGIVQQSFASFFEPDYFSGYTTFAVWGINGTSQATPHVSGTAALLMAAGVPASSIEEILEHSTTDIGAAGYDTEYGWGLLNAANAFSYPTIRSLSQNSADNNSATNITITGTNFSSSSPSGAIGSTALANVVFVSATSMTATVPAHLAAGTYNISITSGGKTATLTNGFTVSDPAPSTPSNFAAAGGDEQIILSWSKPSAWDFAGVKIMRKKGSYPANQSDGTLVYQGKKTTKINKNLKNGKKYYYSAFAYDSGGNYSSAAQANATPNLSYLITTPDRGKSTPTASYDDEGSKQSKTFNPFGKGYKGGINVATGDLDGNGVQEIIFGTQEGQTPRIRMFDRKGNEKFKEGGFYPFGKFYRCGVNVAAGDVNNDKKDEIIAGAGYGCPSMVKIFNKRGKLISKKASFKPYGGKTGVKVAVGDVNGNNTDEIITAPGKGLSARIYIYNQKGKKVLNKKGFLAFPKLMKSGVELFAGDVNFNGKSEIVVVPKSGSADYVKIFNYSGKKVYKKPGFYPFGSGYKDGVNMTVGDLNSDGYAEILVAKKNSGGVNIYSYKKQKKTPKKIDTISVDAGSLLVVGKMK